MYISFDRARYCVRRLNGTHEVGCQSAMRGNSGRMYMIDNEQEFTSFLTNTATIDLSNSFIIVLNVNLFDSNHVDQLMNRLDKKLNGLLLYLKSNLSRPEYFSHDDQCPNHRYSYYLNQTESVKWNWKGTGLFFRSFPFPIMLVDEENDYKQLLHFYQQFNSSQSTPACGLEMKTFQNAAHTSKTCMRRNDISHSLIDLPEIFCDPIGGQNIYSKLPQTITTIYQQRSPKSVVLILVNTDSFQMFLKPKGATGGAQQPAAALIAFLTLAHLIGQEQNELKKQDKEIIFLTLDGDAMDYSASFKFMFDMINGYFPNGDKNEQRIKPEHIHSIIELQGLSMTDKLWLHSYPSSLINQTFINTILRNNPMITSISSNSPLPPASSQIFLRETSSMSFPAYILSSANDNQLSNHYYHSFFDDPSTLSINISTLEYNTDTEFSQWIKRIVEPLAQTLIESFVGIRKNLIIKQEIINNLVYCILKNINCPLIHNVTNQSVGNTFKQFDQTSMPFSINTYPESTTPTFPFVQYVLSYFLRDRAYDLQNITSVTCKEYAANDTLYSYKYVGGYLPSINNEEKFSSYCVRSYIRLIQSMSPAFTIKNYDLSDAKYPAWTESRWTVISLRLFLIPTRQHEVMTVVIDWNQQENAHYSNGDTSLHSVHGQIHAGPHSVPAHTDNGLDPNLLNNDTNDSGAFVTAGTAGQVGFDVRTLGLSEQELKETGLHPSLISAGRQLPLDQYKINYDPNPIIIRKQIPVEMPTYKQQVIVRYLRPPTPPSPGPLIIKEVREPPAAAAPPLVIRTRAPREKTPPPIVIREAPPCAPHVDLNPKYVTRVVRHNESNYSSSPQQQQRQFQQQQQYHQLQQQHQPQHHPQQQQQQQQQQFQHFNTFENGTVNYDQFNGIQNGNQFTNEINSFGDQQHGGWVTEVVSSTGTTSAAPPHLLDDIYRAINNQLPRV
ncbi:unnamed protein product [Adineta steineri]|uniref:Nicastrin n=1 Tax=Adineta steineri TaxID=433720 RepID=A0A815FWW9_9BILA|nr:unnamed protein product [Adineta steineri]CAF0956640.1 unnamed protein product [Adineta steineri]CAF1330983.1 unnamed protein product [Adineta steineri]CAF1331267.1 unnamed protein product [Adineta steineri]